ncbi:unnamed protein product [Rhizopus microsporus]
MIRVKVNQKKGLVKIKTHRVGVTEVLYKQLKKRQKSGELLLAMMNEFCTSKVCHPCQDMTLTTTMIDLHSVLTCKSCGIIWQRDLNAFKTFLKSPKTLILDTVVLQFSCDTNNAEALTFFISPYRTKDLDFYRQDVQSLLLTGLKLTPSDLK